MIDFYCSEWDPEAEEVKEGPHGEVDEVILRDAYFVAYEISDHMPDGQYVDERDVEGVDFTIDVSGDTVTEDDVSSRSSGYLKKFPGVYEGVAGYVNNLDHIPAERFQCPHCTNYLTSEDKLDVRNE